MPKLTWNDAEDLGMALYERFPTLDPLTVRFTELHQWVCEMPGFIGKPDESTEAKLEAIQMAWLEEWKDNQE